MASTWSRHLADLRHPALDDVGERPRRSRRAVLYGETRRRARRARQASPRAPGTLINLALTRSEKLETRCPPALESVPDYPWGTRITLSQREIEKLGLDLADARVGDVIDLRCLGRVIGVNRTENALGPEDRVELQITDMAVEE